MAALGGCGFQPVYGPQPAGSPSVQTDLSEIGVAIIPNRDGQLLRQALQARFERQGIGISHRYDLIASLSISDEGIGTLPENANTRTRVIGTANWQLLAQDPQRTTLDSGVARAVDGFDIVNEQFFAAEMAHEAAVRRLTTTIADTVTLQLSLYFKRHPTPTG